MKATLYKTLSNRQTPIEVKAGQTVARAFPELDLENAIIVVNGRIEKPDYVLQETDKTDETLSHGICQNTFHNILRCDNPQEGHPETKMTFVPIKVNQRFVPSSHIFKGENPEEIKISKKSGIRYTPSNVLFNDEYFEKNPKINPQKKKGYAINKLWQQNKYSNGQLINSKSCKFLSKKKIDDNYNK